MTYTLYGWPVSPYTAKTRAYLQYKRVIPWQEITPTALQLVRKIGKAVGRPIMPTIQTPEGSWWQDSSDIIDRFEDLYPERSVIPSSPRQRLASYLLELHGDEWLIVSALYYRWTIPQNKKFAIEEFGRYGAPLLPSILRRPIATRMANQMQAYLPMLGATGATTRGWENYTLALLDNLETHLTRYEYLLGTRPCIGDFSLFGPIWAHLYRDTATTAMFDTYPSVRAWLARLLQPTEAPGAFCPEDEVPETLEPIFRQLFAEQFVFLESLVDTINQWCREHPDAERVPRSLGQAEFQVGNVRGTRKLITFSQWMLQRAWSVWNHANAEEQKALRDWLKRVNGMALTELPLRHPLVRRNYREFLA